LNASANDNTGTGQADVEANETDLGRYIPIESKTALNDSGQTATPIDHDRCAENGTAQRAAANNDRYRRLVETQVELVTEIDPDGRLIYVSPSCCRAFGKTAPELLGGSYIDLLHDAERNQTAERLAGLSNPPHRCYLEQRLLTRLGWRWFGWSHAAVLDANRCLTSIVSVGREITERKHSEKVLAEVNERLALALEGGDIGLYTADRPLGTAFADARYFAMLGYAPGDIRLDPETWPTIVHPDDWTLVAAQTRRVLRSETDTFEAEYRMRHRDGHWVWILNRARVHTRDANGAPIRTAGTHLDVTRRKEAELKLNYLADHDELTGLLNRRGTWQSIQRIHADSIRGARPHALAIVDIDHFKQVNDTFGHAAGDLVLRDIAQTLRAGVREADWTGRWGGEEFLSAVPGTTETQALNALERLRKRIFDTPIQINDRQIQVTVSIGLAVSQTHDDSLENVLSRADEALYRAKDKGRNQVCYVGTDSGAQAFTMAVLVRSAIEEGGIRQAFQPIVDLRSRVTVGEQAVAQVLETPHLALSADGFIDVAQQLGLLPRVDLAMFRAIAQRANRRPADESPLLQFIHLSGALISHPEMIAGLADELGQSVVGSTPALPLVLTISERQMQADTEQVAEALKPLVNLGCRLAISDFGSQASSVCFLTQLPVDFVGIDTELIQLAAESPRARAFLAGIRRCAVDLGIKTIAKQVEDEATARRLIDLGIDWGHGGLFGGPSVHLQTPTDPSTSG